MISMDFEKLVESSFRECLSLVLEEKFSHSEFNIESIDTDKIADMEEAIVLTISSHLFTIFIALYFTCDEELKNTLKLNIESSGAKLEKSLIYDYLSEVGNIFCGAMKREIQRTVPSLGMSTPNILSGKSMYYINTLKIDKQGALAVKQGNKPMLYARYVVSAYGPIDYKKAVTSEPETSAGELEFF